jgi:hypothetical protein
MSIEETSDRKFSNGKWDLRKDERRQNQAMIAFPDRRKDERRLTKMHDHYASRMDVLSWGNKPEFNE